MKRVLILCTGNSCRSQMAEALWAQSGAGQWQSESAGSQPSGYVHPLAIAAMREISIDISDATSKSVETFDISTFDLIITVCDNARESCPTSFGSLETRHWPFEDPADATGSEDAQLQVFRQVRDQIQAAIEHFLSTGLDPSV